MPIHVARSLRFRLVLALAGLIVPQVLPAGAGRAPLTVFAAASLKESLDDATADYTRRTGTAVRVSYAASPALARQIAQGAPADVFVSADRAWMDDLEARRLLRRGTRRDLLGNALVLIAPHDARLPPVSPDRPSSIPDALGNGRLAVALTSSVPAGRYARAALDSLGMWSTLRPRVVETENVRAALLLVARGEARMGIVYASDARAEPRVRVLAVFPSRSHPPIVYPVAVTAGARHPHAGAFATWLRTPPARAIFVRHGFRALP